MGYLESVQVADLDKNGLKELYVIYDTSNEDLSAKLWILNNDANDFFEVNLKPGSYNASIPSPSRSGNYGKTTFPIVVKPEDNQIHQLQLRKDGQK